jgi:tRNA-dihydrouridine synthase
MTDQIATAAPPILTLAPLQGVTEVLFRNLFARHFTGFDAAMAPFVKPQGQARFPDRLLRDILPAANTGLPLIPQLLHNDAANFLAMADRIADLGYREVNWNLGCPAPMIVRKKRGSGLLPHPETIIALLDDIVPRLRLGLSIKTRLGLNDRNELLTLLPRLDAYPLTEVIIHARLGRQLYDGRPDLDGFAACLPLTRHRLAYNGDITDVAGFNALRFRFPQIGRWMIGRGALADPFLPMAIKGLALPGRAERNRRIRAFHDDLYAAYRDRLAGPAHLLGRMKQLWAYLIASFPGQEKLLKKINKAMTEERYDRVVGQLWETAETSGTGDFHSIQAE